MPKCSISATDVKPGCRQRLTFRQPTCRPVGAACPVCGDNDCFIFDGDIICPTCVNWTVADEDAPDDAA